MNPQQKKEAKSLFDSVKRGMRKLRGVEVVACPPFAFLASLVSDKKVKLGAQDIFWEDKGAFTGEVSASMLKDLRVEYVLVGHSERRKYQKETDVIINKKIKAALGKGLKVVLCIDKISQLRQGLKGISKKELKAIVLAYEPLFAIGTGKACSPERAKKMRLSMKKALRKNNRILYGGSVNSQNAASYIKEAGFNGLLVGGASLKPKEFLGIVKNVS